MSFLRRRQKPNMDGANLLMALLICYPEIGTVSFEPGNRETLNFAFTLKALPPQPECENIGKLLRESILAYHSLVGLSAGRIDLCAEGHGTAAFFHVSRDMETLSFGEIKMISQIMRDFFGDRLLTDREAEDFVPDENEMLANEEAIDNMLGTVKVLSIPNRMIGFREDGRVMVYNK